jgi:cathepsin D
VPRLTSNKNLSPHWTLELEGITAGGKPVTAVPPKTPAVLDTGATIIVAPVNDTRAFYANIPGAVINTAYSRMIGMDLYNVPCNTTFNTAFKIGGIDYPLDNSDLFFVHSGNNGGGSGCFGAVTGGGIDFWLLGDTFLKNVYSAFRVDPPQIGLGKLKHK